MAEKEGKEVKTKEYIYVPPDHTEYLKMLVYLYSNQDSSELHLELCISCIGHRESFLN